MSEWWYCRTYWSTRREPVRTVVSYRKHCMSCKLYRKQRMIWWTLDDSVALMCVTLCCLVTVKFSHIWNNKCIMFTIFQRLVVVISCIFCLWELVCNEKRIICETAVNKETCINVTHARHTRPRPAPAVCTFWSFLKVNPSICGTVAAKNNLSFFTFSERAALNVTEDRPIVAQRFQWWWWWWWWWWCRVR